MQFRRKDVVEINHFIRELNKAGIDTLEKLSKEHTSMRFYIENGEITGFIHEQEEIPTQTANPSGDNK